MQPESLHMQALLLLLKRLGKSNLSMRSHLRISIYMDREMFLYPIPNRGKEISSINTLEFLLCKQAQMIFSHTVWRLVLSVNIDDCKNKHHFELAKLFIILSLIMKQKTLFISSVFDKEHLYLH